MTIKIPFLLLFLITFYYNKLFAQYEKIDSLVITNTDVRVKVSRGQGISYANSSYYTSNDTCFLDICYYDGTSPADDEDSITLPITLPSSAGDYVFKLITSFTYVVGTCDDSIRFDSTTVNFSIPFTETIAVSNEEHIKRKELSIYPNPTSDIINIPSGVVLMSTPKLFDVNGRLVRTIEKEEKGLSVCDLNKGLYFLKLETKQGVVLEKIIVH